MSGVTALPPRTDPHWKDLATGKINRPWSNLAMKIMMSRILRETSADPSSATVMKCADEIYMFFQKNIQIAQADLAAALR